MIMLGGCACCCGAIGPIGPDPELVRSDIIGSWSANEGSRISFAEDGTFTATDLDVCDDDFFDLRPDAGSGTWELKEGTFMYPYQKVVLSFHKPIRTDDEWLADDDEVLARIGDYDAANFCFFNRD